MDTWNIRAKARLKEVGRTQDWLAEQFEMTPGGVQKWLAGTRQPSLEEINRIAHLLHCPPVWLTHGLDAAELTDGLKQEARDSLRYLIAAERSTPLPTSFWQAVTSMAKAVIPAKTERADRGAESPTSNAAPRNGTHG